MSEKGKYCCFDCPKGDFSEKELDSTCPDCGKQYDFPLTEFPERIETFRIESSLGRGFYGAAYTAEKEGLINSRHVLKVVPKKVYEFFSKGFEDECSAHNKAARGANFIVGITDAFESSVSFGRTELDSYVAVLDYVDGCLLQDYLAGKKPLDAATAAQIASDLFSIKNELAVRQINHNDFHAGNIMVEDLARENHRREAMKPEIRAVAIDLGSLAGDRRDGNGYKSDLRWLANHIEILSNILLQKEDDATDLDKRLALELRLIAQSISSFDENQRIDNFDEYNKKIQEAFYRTTRSWKPWRSPFRLKKFDEWTNAQILDAWNVPQLLVDPDGEWQRSICSAGPLIVTGMRGCGKTMLLRSLQFHARAAQQEDESDSSILSRLKADEYVGLFQSAANLLKTTGEESISPENMFARLAIGYTKSAIESLSHLEDIDRNEINHRAIISMGDCLASLVDTDETISLSEDLAQSITILDHLLLKCCAVNSAVKLKSNPAIAFPQLAKCIRDASKFWADNQVLFLLDDVSTRFLKPDQIEDIISGLIFQNSNCAFKITSETQAIFLSLKSPGGVEPAAAWRDFKTFDLGADVHRRLKRGGGKKFLADILSARAKLFSLHPSETPEVVLGDQTLNEIAERITTSGPNSKIRKSVYHGISALRAVCVGDIGTAITIYENIQAQGKLTYPVSAQDQSDAFQQYSSSLVYSLDRRGSGLKAAAKSFAKASYTLMMESKGKKEKRGLRQYSSIYVRITSGDKEEQGKKLRELVDAGVFVFQGGGPRTKTKDSDPISQFKLTFRKIYGLADFIGLAERDRFELSGDELENWLKSPERGEEILMRNLRTGDSGVDVDLDDDLEDEEAVEPSSSTSSAELQNESRKPVQGSLFDNDLGKQIFQSDKLPLPNFAELSDGEIDNLNGEIDTLVLALGFEERARDSALATAKRMNPKKVICIKYPDEKGYTDEILEGLSSLGFSYDTLPHPLDNSQMSSVFSGLCAVDITGLSKSGIFKMLRYGANFESGLLICYSPAQTYYPLEKDLAPILESYRSKNYEVLLENLKSVLTGEIAPYSVEELYSVPSDSTRMKVLIAFASAKHERLIHLVEEQDFDLVKVIVDSSDSARATVGKLAAEVAVRGASSASIEACDIKDPIKILETMERVYRNAYREGGLNFEIGLTGDKIEAAAAAAFSAKFPVNKIWYVKPKKFDTKRFTKGIATTRYFRLS